VARTSLTTSYRVVMVSSVPYIFILFYPVHAYHTYVPVYISHKPSCTDLYVSTSCVLYSLHNIMPFMMPLLHLSLYASLVFIMNIVNSSDVKAAEDEPEFCRSRAHVIQICQNLKGVLFFHRTRRLSRVAIFFLSLPLQDGLGDY
jgi:hypothetical protein